MNHFRKAILSSIFLCYLLSSNAQSFRVQIAAYIDQVPFDYFSEANIFGVYMLTDQNNIYRYYIGEFNELKEAEAVVNEAIKKGFKNALVIDVEEQRRLCGKPCPYISPTSTYSDDSTEPLSLHNVFFGFNQSILTESAKRALDQVVRTLSENPQLKILVSGHTDSQGSADYNVLLSKRRARNAKNYLIYKGIKSSRIKAEVFGEAIPEKDNVDEEGRKYNRRVVMAIFDPNSGQVIFSKK